MFTSLNNKTNHATDIVSHLQKKENHKNIKQYLVSHFPVGCFQDRE